MANRFNQLRQDPYISTNTYVPMPLQEIAGMAKDYSDNYKANIKELDETNDLYSKVNAIDKHQGYKKALVDEFTKRTEELAERFASGQDLFKAERDLHKLRRDWLNNPIRQELEKSYIDYGTDIKAVNELKSKGLYTDVYDPFKNFKGVNADGSIEGYRTRGAKPSQDYLKVGTELMKDIAKSARNGKSYRIDPNTGDVIGLESGWEKLLQEDVDRVAQNSITPFLKSKEGEFYIDELKDRNPNLTNADIVNSAYSYLSSLGNKQIFTKKTSGTTLDRAPKHIFDMNNQPNIPLPQTTEGVEMMNFTSPEFKNLRGSNIIKSDGTIDWSKISGSIWKNVEGAPLNAGMLGNSPTLYKSDVSSKEANERHRDLSTVVRQAINMIGKENVEAMLGKSVDELNSTDYNKLIPLYMKTSQVRGYNGTHLAGAEKSSLQEDIFTHPKDYELLDDKLQLSTGDVENFRKGMYNDKEFVFNTEAVHNIDGKSYIQGSVVNKKTGEVKTAYFRPKTKEFKQHFDDVANVSKKIAESYALNTPLPKARDPRFKDHEVLAEVSSDGGKTLTTVYRTPTGEELVIGYDIKKVPTDEKGKYKTVLDGGIVLGTSFKEYQQLKHLAFARHTSEGGNLYQNNMSQQKATEDQLGR